MLDKMNVYRIIFADNEAISCTIVDHNTVLNGLYQYEHKNGNLVYAIINAKNEDNALTIANFISTEIKQKLFGTDFLN